MKKTPTLEEVVNGQIQICCSNHGCEKCPIEIYRKGIGGSCYSCDMTFLHAVVSGKLNLDGTPISAEADPAKPTLPKWCIEGQWVTPRTLMRPMRIIYIDPFSHKIDLEIGGDPTRFGAEVKDYLPIRFRLPTLQESYALLGKVMAFKDGTRELICIVGEDEVTGGDIGTERMLFVNHKPAECLQSCSIDGHPFGVPEVDEEAEKEEQE